MREILKLTARDKGEAIDALQKAAIELEENVDDDDINIDISVKAPEDGGFAFIFGPNELG